MKYMCPITTFIYLFFSFTFFSSTCFFPHSHQISFLFLHSPSCLFFRSSSSPKIQFFFFTQKTRRKNYITQKMRVEEAATTEEESHSRRKSSQQQWVYGFMLELKFAHLIQNFVVCLVGQKLEERKRKKNHYYMHGVILLLGFLQLMRREHKVQRNSSPT